MQVNRLVSPHKRGEVGCNESRSVVVLTKTRTQKTSVRSPAALVRDVLVLLQVLIRGEV